MSAVVPYGGDVFDQDFGVMVTVNHATSVSDTRSGQKGPDTIAEM